MWAESGQCLFSLTLGTAELSMPAMFIAPIPLSGAACAGRDRHRGARSSAALLLASPLMQSLELESWKAHEGSLELSWYARPLQTGKHMANVWAEQALQHSHEPQAAQ